MEAGVRTEAVRRAELESAKSVDAITDDLRGVAKPEKNFDGISIRGVNPMCRLSPSLFLPSSLSYSLARSLARVSPRFRVIDVSRVLRLNSNGRMRPTHGDDCSDIFSYVPDYPCNRAATVNYTDATG